MREQPRQDRIYHAWYSGCGGIRQRKTVRLGRVQELREIMVLRSTYHKPTFSARHWDGRVSCTDGEKIARPRRTGDRSVELPCVAPQCNRRITCSGTNGSSTSHTTSRCERTNFATSTPRWGHPKLRSTCRNDVKAMLRSATRCTQITKMANQRC